MLFGPGFESWHWLVSAKASVSVSADASVAARVIATASAIETWQVDSVFSDLGLISGRKHLEVIVKSAAVEDSVIERLVQVPVKQNVVFDGRVSNPGLRD